MEDSRSSVTVVDDDPSVLKAITRLLSAAGFRVLPFASGGVLLASPEGAAADCLLLDIRMPGLDGFAVARRVRESTPAVPIIFMTAHDTESNLRRAHEHGADTLLLKPISEEKLIGAIRGSLHHDRRGDETKVP